MKSLQMKFEQFKFSMREQWLHHKEKFEEQEWSAENNVNKNCDRVCGDVWAPCLILTNIIFFI